LFLLSRLQLDRLLLLSRWDRCFLFLRCHPQDLLLQLLLIRDQEDPLDREDPEGLAWEEARNLPVESGRAADCNVVGEIEQGKRFE
jgi:hypothetical protein